MPIDSTGNKKRLLWPRLSDLVPMEKHSSFESASNRAKELAIQFGEITSIAESQNEWVVLVCSEIYDEHLEKIRINYFINFEPTNNPEWQYPQWQYESSRCVDTQTLIVKLLVEAMNERREGIPKSVLQFLVDRYNLRNEDDIRYMQDPEYPYDAIECFGVFSGSDDECWCYVGCQEDFEDTIMREDFDDVDI